MKIGYLPKFWAIVNVLQLLADQKLGQHIAILQARRYSSFAVAFEARP